MSLPIPAQDPLALIGRVSQLFNLSLNLDDVLERVMDEVIAATSAERGFLILRADEGQLTFHAARGLERRTIESPEFEISRGVVERVIGEGAPRLTSDAQSDPQLSLRQSVKRLNLRSILCVPLQNKGSVFGAIYVDNRLQAGMFLPEDLKLLGALAHYSAIAIENVRLFHNVNEQLQSLHLLHQISSDLTSTLDLNRVLTACLERVKSLLNAAAASVLMIEGEELVFRVAVGEKSEQVKPFRIPKSQGIAGWVVQNACGTFSNDVPADPRFYSSLDRSTGFATRMLVAAPLIVQDRVIGVIEVFNKPGGFTQADLDLLSTIAASAAIAIENARLYEVAVETGRMERELQVARQVQASLIPRTAPRAPGWDFAAHWQSALETSGDFYDFVLDHSPDVGIIIGDVADKGVPAALFMTLTRTIMRANAAAGLATVDSLAHANRLICADAPSGMFVTLCHARINTVSGLLRYANAGHPPPLLYRAAHDSVTELKRHGTALGLTEGAVYEEESVQMESGDVVLFYTDGVTDATNENEELFGKERLRLLLQQCCHPLSLDIPRRLQATLADFVGASRLMDDLTFVVVQRT